MKDAHFTPKDIDEVVLVGGSTRVPKVQQVVKEMFDGKEPHKGVNPGRSRGRRAPRSRAACWPATCTTCCCWT